MPQARAGTARTARGLASATGHAGSLLRELTCEVESGGIRVGGGDRAVSFEASLMTQSAPSGALSFPGQVRVVRRHCRHGQGRHGALPVMWAPNSLQDSPQESRAVRGSMNNARWVTWRA